MTSAVSWRVPMGPADQPAGGEVDHGGQVQPPLAGAHVGDVAAQNGVEQVRLERPADQVRDRRGLLVGLGQRPPTARAMAP
jgi:hypothetical protein